MKKIWGILIVGLLLTTSANAELFSFSKKMQKLSPGDSPSIVEKKDVGGVQTFFIYSY